MPSTRSPLARLPWFLALSAGCVACGPSSETHHLPPELVGMTDDVAPIYDDGQTQLYEVRQGTRLPVLSPTDAEREGLRQGRVGPFSRSPWVESEDIRVEVTWYLVNLDRDMHTVEILIDPWNEFGRYEPGFTVVDEQNGEALPNLSGIDIRRELPGREDSRGRSSRVSGTFTFDDMSELIQDFATVINILERVEPPPADSEEDDPRIEWVNHTFNVQNRQGSTPLTDRYRPDVIPALTGFDVGLRTTEPANIAIEVAVEILDETGERIRADDSQEPILRAPDRRYTLGGG